MRQFILDWRALPLDARTCALLELAENSTRAPNSVTHNDIARLRAFDLSDEEIHDAMQVIGYFNYINRIADGLGVEPDDWLLGFESELELKDV